MKPKRLKSLRTRNNEQNVRRQVKSPRVVPAVIGERVKIVCCEAVGLPCSLEPRGPESSDEFPVWIINQGGLH